VTLNPDFKVNLFNVKKTRKWCKVELYLQWQTNSKSCDLSNGAVFNDLERPFPDFKVTPLFDAEYPRHGTGYRHSFNKILIGTYTCPTERCHFEINNDKKRRAVSLRQLSCLF